MILAQIKRLCKEKKTTICRIERELGFSNGTIRGWCKADPGAKRLKAVADYFGVMVDELLTESEPTKTA